MLHSLLVRTPWVGPTLENRVFPRVNEVCQAMVVCGLSYSCFALVFYSAQSWLCWLYETGFYIRAVFKAVLWLCCLLMVSIWQATSYFCKRETGNLDPFHFTPNPSCHTHQQSLFCARLEALQFLLPWPGCHARLCMLFILLLITQWAIRSVYL